MILMELIIIKWVESSTKSRI